MLKAIIFDVGNVLISWPGKAVYDDIREELGLSDEQLSLFSKEYLYKLGLGKINEKDLWAGARREFHIRKVDVNENLLSREFKAKSIVYKDVLQLVRNLKTRGFKIALLSNSIAAHERVLANKGILQPFEYVFLSHKIGLRKPDSKIYLYALQRLRLEPSETLFVDDLEENIESAQRLKNRGNCNTICAHELIITQENCQIMCH